MSSSASSLTPDQAAEPRSLATLNNGICHRPRDQLDGADGVVIARNHEIDFFGVAVRVDDGDDRDTQSPRFRHGDVFFVRVDDKNT